MSDSNKTKRSKKPKASAHSSGPQDDKTQPSKLFTIDANSPDWTQLNQMPSISRLLDRKKLFRDGPPAHAGVKKPSPAAPPASAETVEKTATLPAASFFDDATAEGSPVPPPAPVMPAAAARVQPAQRRNSAIQVLPLYHWTAEQLKGTADPMGPSILDILQRGAMTVLFLARDPSPLPGGATGFLAKAFSGAPGKANIWKGLKWHSNILPPDLWKFLLQEGSIEFPPPATQTHEHSSRNILRTSFGAQRNEWLILTRVGPEIQIRGLIAIISRQSIHGPIRSALEEMWKAYTPATLAAVRT